MMNKALEPPSLRAGSTHLNRLTSPAHRAGLFDNRRPSWPARHIFIDSLRRLIEPACSTTAGHPGRLDMHQRNKSCRHSVTLLCNMESAWPCLVVGFGAAAPDPARRRQGRRRRPPGAAASPPLLFVEYVLSVIEPLEIHNGGLSFTNGKKVGSRRPFAVFPLRDIPPLFDQLTSFAIRKRTNFASQPALPVVLWKHPCKLSFRITKLLYEDSVSFVLEE